MTPIKSVLFLFFLIVALKPASAQETKDPEFVNEARAIVGRFQSNLKSELQTAILQGGFLQTVSVCSQRAPEIADSLSKETGWDVGRTSLKTRNSLNTPDQTEYDALQLFEERKKKGEAIQNMEWWEENREEIRYIKAIPMQGLCVSCHGENIAPSLKEHIRSLYPHDTATGFQPGDIRGAFSLKKSFHE